MRTLTIGTVQPKQWLFMTDKHRHIAYGGARGGGKSWAVRAKGKLLALRYPGIKILIVRRTMPELRNNHIDQLRTELKGFAKYNQTEKIFRFPNGSSIAFGYCAKVKTVTIPSTVTEIGEYAFYNCTSLLNITVDNAESAVSVGKKWYPTMNGKEISELKISWR